MKDLSMETEDPIRKPFLALAVITLGCLLLLGISIFLPMFVIEYDSREESGREEFYLSDYRYVSDDTGPGDLQNYDTQNSPFKDLARAGEWTKNLCLIALVGFLALVLSFVLAGLGKLNPMVSLIISVCILILCTIIAVYGITSFSSPMMDFYNLDGNLILGSQGNYSWSPGLGWFFILVSTLGVLGCGITDAVLVWKESKKRNFHPDN
jgi:amino acid transporter